MYHDTSLFIRTIESSKCGMDFCIGIDSHSLDYKLMTNKILEKHKVELIESPYNQIVQRIVAGEIDAAIWNLDEVKSKNYPLSYQMIKDPMVKRHIKALFSA